MKPNTVKCPRCGMSIDLVREGDRQRAYHDCIRGALVPVYDRPYAPGKPEKSDEPPFEQPLSEGD